MKDSAFRAGRGWNRREFAGGLALLALAVGVPVAAIRLSELDERDAPGDREIAMMKAVAQYVLPATGTPGAGDAGVGAFVLLALAHGLDGTRDPAASSASSGWGLAGHVRTDGSLRFADWLAARLDRRAGGDWLGKPAVEQAEALSALDAEAFAEGADAHPWRKLKGLILTGYYTSEIGGSQELRYELVPGRFDPAVPLHPGDRAWSSDWTGVEFG